MEQRQVKIGKSFFRKERDNAYADFGQAFWRENFQNSIDAGARNIRITITDAYDNPTSPLSVPQNQTYKITFDDDGCGMNADTLNNVFFCLGETTKNDNSTIGGFARARIMTHFAAESYSIHTQNCSVQGSADQYFIQTADYYQGCKMSFIIHSVNKYNSPVNLHKELEDFLTKCYLNCNVYINGSPWNTWAYRRKVVNTLSFGTLHVNKSSELKCIALFRVNGVVMFVRHISVPYLIIVEIDPNKSRQVLTSSRDHISFDYQQELDKFLNDLSSNTQKALSDKKQDRYVSYGEERFFTNRRKRNNLVEKISAKKSIPSFKQDYLIPSLQPITESSQVFVEPEVKKCFDFMIHENFGSLAYDPSRVMKAAKKYHPHQWYVKERGSLKFVGGTRAKLIIAWQSICNDLVDIFLEYRDMEELNWGVGFCFANEEASCYGNDRRKIFFLNPVNKNGKMKYKITKKDDINKLIIIAAHEICHVLISDHDEMYACMLTDFIPHILPKLSLIRKNVKRAVYDYDKYWFGFSRQPQTV